MDLDGILSTLMVPEIMLPAQQSRGIGAETGEQRLAVAILKDVLRVIYRATHNPTNKYLVQLQHDLDWLQAEEQDCPWALHLSDLCGILGLDVDAMRAGLLKLAYGEVQFTTKPRQASVGRGRNNVAQMELM